MTAKVLKIILDGREILIDRKDLKGIDLSNLRITDHGYVMLGDKYLHRLILNPSTDMQIDHINKNKLDNRRCNLRVCTNSENQMNRGKTRANTVGVKGVYRARGSIKKIYRAQIKANKKTYYLGSFEKPDEAGAAYKKAAKQLHGEFARVNDP